MSWSCILGKKLIYDTYLDRPNTFITFHETNFSKRNVNKVAICLSQSNLEKIATMIHFKHTYVITKVTSVFEKLSTVFKVYINKVHIGKLKIVQVW